MSEKCLLDQWSDMAYDRSLSKDQLEKFWGKYFTIEREIYEQLLDDPDTEVKGTVKELAEIRTGRHDNGRFPGRYQ